MFGLGGNHFYSRDVVNPTAMFEPLGVTPDVTAGVTNLSVVEPQTDATCPFGWQCDLIGAHELGHQLSLDDVDQVGQLMNGDIASVGEDLSPTECDQARAYGRNKGYFWRV